MTPICSGKTADKDAKTGFFACFVIDKPRIISTNCKIRLSYNESAHKAHGLQPIDPSEDNSLEIYI